MKLRNKRTGELASSGQFNTHSLCEILVYFEEGADSDYIENYDVWLESKQAWKSLRRAFKDHDVICDNYNTIFFEPKNEEDRIRGFTLS